MKPLIPTSYLTCALGCRLAAALPHADCGSRYPPPWRWRRLQLRAMCALSLCSSHVHIQTHNRQNAKTLQNVPAGCLRGPSEGFEPRHADAQSCRSRTHIRENRWKMLHRRRATTHRRFLRSISNTHKRNALAFKSKKMGEKKSLPTVDIG